MAICEDGAIQEKEFKHKDFMLITSDEEIEFLIEAKDNELRLIMIEVPTQVYPK
ncbi:hypothetical protein [Litchfieldia salsa]|uniref:hypothetical protein n=1 Tax=Litchfieldia salsa TaxID=930152 RepID=UPI001EE3E036|nr:hypothetical protein [Litchfieldia salsa]